MSSTVQANLGITLKVQETTRLISGRKDHFRTKAKLESIVAREGSW